MNRILAAAKETGKYWGLPVLIAFAVELATNKENSK